MGDPLRFRVVFLCTGNRARSAVAEAMLRAMTADTAVEVGSAGLLNLDPGPALPEAIDAAKRLGFSLSAHQSRPLSTIDIEKANLVIGFERQHIATAVVDAGAASERTFLLREFVRLLQLAPVSDEPDLMSRATRAVEQAHRLRSMDSVFHLEDEIPDPFGRSSEVFVEMTAHIHDLVRQMAMHLFGVTAAPPPVFTSPRSTSDRRLRILRRSRDSQ